MIIATTSTGMFTPIYWYKKLHKIIPNLEIIDINYNSTPNKIPDLIIFDGGEDVTPFLYGEKPEDETNFHFKRDLLERFIALKYLKSKTKFAGICRGQQFLNVLMNGTLYQDLPKINKGHTQFHKVNQTKNSILSALIEKKEFITNSYHHQAIKNLGYGLIPSLIEPKSSIIEGIETNSQLPLPSYLKDKIRAVQCHPENNEFREAPSLLNYLFRIPE